MCDNQVTKLNHGKKKKIIEEQQSEPVTNCDQLVKVDVNSAQFDSGDIILSQYEIEKLIINIRGKQVLIDRDLAMISGYRQQEALPPKTDCSYPRRDVGDIEVIVNTRTGHNNLMDGLEL